MRLRVRWIIFAYLFAFGFLAYVQRVSIGVAAERMMPGLGFSQVEVGWLLTAFLIGYTAFQIPGGLFGERVGARRALAVIGLLAFVATVATPLAPLALVGTSLFVALLIARTTVGIAQAPIFPVSAGVVESWFPVGKWAFPTGLQAAGMLLGGAATPPIIAGLMGRFGWNWALLWTSLPELALVALWWWYGRDRPQEHPSISNVELEEIRANREEQRVARPTLRELGQVLTDRNIILLSISYLLMSMVFYLLTFWCFLYLVQERHFTVLEGGWLASLPFVAAAVGAVIGGRGSDALCKSWGLKAGFRVIPLVALPVAGVLLFAAVKAGSPYWAVAWLSATFAALELTEGAFMAATMSVARTQTMAAVGVVNTASNLGGIIATPAIAALSAAHGWTSAFLAGSVAAAASGALWLWIDASRPLQVCSSPGQLAERCGEQLS